MALNNDLRHVRCKFLAEQHTNVFFDENTQGVLVFVVQFGVLEVEHQICFENNSACLRIDAEFIFLKFFSQCFDETLTDTQNSLQFSTLFIQCIGYGFSSGQGFVCLGFCSGSVFQSFFGQEVQPQDCNNERKHKNE